MLASAGAVNGRALQANGRAPSRWMRARREHVGGESVSTFGSGKIDIGLQFAAQKQVMPSGAAWAQIKIFVVVTACTCP
jgi:hypothetical protein